MTDEQKSISLVEILDSLPTSQRVRLMSSFDNEVPDYIFYDDTDTRFIGVHLNNTPPGLRTIFSTANGWSVGVTVELDESVT